MRIPLKSILLLLLPFTSFGQKTVLPGNPDIKTSRLKSERSLFTIYYVKDRTWTRKGEFTNDLTILGNEIKLTVNYTDDSSKWYRKRVSVADAKTLSPISYTSEGLKNKLSLTFGDQVTGKYQYKDGAKDKDIKLKPPGKYVDFNMAELLFTTLPLSTGYKATIPEFYYADSPDTLVSNYIIKDVKSYIYRSPKTGNHESWMIDILEEPTGVYYTYVVDKKDFRIWQREMPAGKGIVEVCVNEELDYQPIKSKFNKEETFQLLEKGNSVITGTAFARDHGNSRIAVVNLQKAQYAPRGTVVSIIPNSEYLEEWKAVNKKIRKGRKLPEVPIHPDFAASFKTTKVYDDKGHFEFTNLMPGEYILLTSFGYTHRYSYQYYAGSSNLVHPSGTVLSSTPIYNSASGATGATAEIESKVTIRKDGDKVNTDLKDVR